MCEQIVLENQEAATCSNRLNSTPRSLWQADHGIQYRISGVCLFLSFSRIDRPRLSVPLILAGRQNGQEFHVTLRE